MAKDRATMGSIVDPALLDKIDKLFACGIGEYIHLPQLVVVGDQSSGKSSVLEGVTKLPFPRDSGLCTRFATQITFRRAHYTSTTITVIPSKNADEYHIQALRAWKKQIDSILDPETFSDVMHEVQTLMGIESEDTFETTTFSEDILKLEVSGPECQHFSVVDVPGIFRTATKGKTTLADADMVKSMVRRYMANPRSVMLVVVPANVDIATQEILTMAEQADPDGHRTLGVLTKPDLVDGGGEKNVMRLVQGIDHPLNLGWCLVRNLGQQHINDTYVDRSSVENAFFRDKEPWNKLDRDRIGIDALCKRLQDVLASMYRGQFSNVKRELHYRLTTAKRSLEALGVDRSTVEEQRRFILDISTRFNEVVSMALTSNYSSSSLFDDDPSLMFVTSVVNRNDRFGEDVEKFGHSYVFGKDFETKIEKLKIADASNLVEVRTTESLPDLEELLSGDLETTYVSGDIKSNTIEWLTNLYSSSRGFELGTFDKNLLSRTMKIQSTKWEPLARGYIFDIIHIAHSFITSLLGAIRLENCVKDALLSVLMEPLIETYRRAIEGVSFILHVERSNPLTINHYFNENLSKAREDRLRSSLDKHAGDYVDIDGQVSRVVTLEKIVQSHPMSNSEHTVFELHDILESYYKVARKRFVDNVCMQAADFNLVTGPHSPLKLFSPQFVNSLTEEQLEEIAGEDAAVKRKRDALTKEVADLQVGKKILG
ncbi:dynamin GTPase [Aureobasidium pullulans]|uniref:Dynamin GTPase n=1 Tax=Aureobasidium pullulans TaxID=5580 RepID=A0A4T0BKD4_AURPU|nr:dynamin GTPase [Aureobasidium pullulans]